jgi:hypothetical protein
LVTAGDAKMIIWDGMKTSGHIASTDAGGLR